jgi:hypothetical protein
MPGIPPNLLRHRCTFEQRTVAQSATSGQSNETWVAKYANERCRLEESGGREFATQTGKMVRSTHVLFINSLPASTINEKDWRLDIGGLKYNILLIADAGGAGHHYEIALERIA